MRLIAALPPPSLALPPADLDDALSLVHLFASLPAAQQVKPVRTAAATRLVREWQYYIARSHALRKVFFSVKGVYFQAEVRGVAITWLQPWAFSQHLPRDVDFRTMLTFLDLYDTLLQVRAWYACVRLGACCAYRWCMCWLLQPRHVTWCGSSSAACGLCFWLCPRLSASEDYSILTDLY